MTRLTVIERGTAVPDVPAAVIDLRHPNEAARQRFARPGAFDPAALVWTDDEPLGVGGPSFVLREHVGWLAPEADRADPTDVVKQVSFLHKSATVDLDGFRTHYRHHVEVARRHMHTLWQYVQYDVEAIEGPAVGPANGIVAVSVLWFASTDDFLHRYFASAEDQRAFTAEEGFLDLTKAFSFIVTSHPSAGPASRPGQG
jgi:hypothetical protein